MRKVSVLFTQQHDWFSTFLQKCMKHDYSHVSLSLDEPQNEFYSFNVRGFARETFEKFRRRHVQKSLLYEIEVSDSVYAQMKEQIEALKRRQQEMKYAFLGIAFCLFHIPFHLKQQFFCSEFVADMLLSSNALRLSKKPSLYLPEHLRAELDQRLGGYTLADVI